MLGPHKTPKLGVNLIVCRDQPTHTEDREGATHGPWQVIVLQGVHSRETPRAARGAGALLRLAVSLDMGPFLSSGGVERLWEEPFRS